MYDTPKFVILDVNGITLANARCPTVVASKGEDNALYCIKDTYIANSKYSQSETPSVQADSTGNTIYLLDTARKLKKLDMSGANPTVIDVDPDQTFSDFSVNSEGYVLAIVDNSSIASVRLYNKTSGFHPIATGDNYACLMGGLASNPNSFHYLASAFTNSEQKVFRTLSPSGGSGPEEFINTGTDTSSIGLNWAFPCLSQVRTVDRLFIRLKWDSRDQNAFYEVENATHTPVKHVITQFKIITGMIADDDYIYVSGSDSKGSGGVVAHPLAVSNPPAGNVDPRDKVILAFGQYTVSAISRAAAGDPKGVVTFSGQRTTDGSQVVATINLAGEVAVSSDKAPIAEQLIVINPK